MFFQVIVCALIIVFSIGSFVHAGDIVAPQLHISKGGPHSPQIALTLDACSGKTDKRILDVLIDNQIPATIFITGRWIQSNTEALTRMLAYPDLFEFENHGLNHVPAIKSLPVMYGIKTAGNDVEIKMEVQGGVHSIQQTVGVAPHWYRDATARYSASAVKLVEDMGYKVAGYSLNADMGASLSAPMVEKRIASARDGDVIIAHINQPSRSAGEGVAKAILALKTKGMRFVRLNDVTTTQTLNPVH